MAVHPRMRGERLPIPIAICIYYGSSPHARGTPRAPVAYMAKYRFIPACAGNACFSRLAALNVTVHPRMRGERVVLRDGLSLLDGSSPHARGTREPVPGGDHPNRFIPACAGNATSSAASRALASVQPRMRGERRLAERCSYTPDGSSPHARGTPRGARADRFPGRFIPACAGNASSSSVPLDAISVHPRMRGERRSYSAMMSTMNGSSPHARGTRATGHQHADRGRFIPACAGNAQDPGHGS